MLSITSHTRHPHTPFFGIVGNMGPQADEVMQSHIRKTASKYGAVQDKDHIPLVVIKNPCIPDRTTAILGKGPSPVPELLRSLRMLSACEVPVAVMPCNTAHYFRSTLLEKQGDVFLLDMLEETVRRLPHGARVALLATNGTIESGIYDHYLQETSLSYWKPLPAEQHSVHESIYGTPNGEGLLQDDGLKAGVYEKNAHKLSEVIHQMTHRHSIDTVILGCTELPLVQQHLEASHPEITFVDPMACVAETFVHVYGLLQQKLQEASRSLSLALPLSSLKTPEEIATFAHHALLEKDHKAP